MAENTGQRQKESELVKRREKREILVDGGCVGELQTTCVVDPGQAGRKVGR